MADYKFPPDVDRYNRICIFNNAEKSKIPISISLAIPQGLAVGDTLQYGSMNLGQLALAGQKMLSGMAGKDITDLGAIADSGKAVFNDLKGQFNSIGNTTVKGAALVQIANKAGISTPGIVSAAAEAAMYNNRTLLNPNQRTTFAGSNTRSFSVEFKLVATSAAEAKTIRDLTYKLRENAYPAGNELVLSYPSEFNIKFLTPDGRENAYISPIFTCYLINMTTTYNGTSNSFYSDGAPLEVSLSLGFTETKALTRADIQALHQGDNRGGRDIGDLGGGEFQDPFGGIGAAVNDIKGQLNSAMKTINGVANKANNAISKLKGLF